MLSRICLAALFGTLLFFGFDGVGLAPNTALAATSTFEQILLEDHMDDGYWVEAFDVNNDSLPDLVTSGLGTTSGQVAWYENPGDLTPSSQWTKRDIIAMPKPVALLHEDVDEDGWLDIVITHDYGACMFECGPNDGKISWLKNPGASGGWTTDWTAYPIGDLVAAHRIIVGHFTSTTESELMVLPIIGYDADVPVEDGWKTPVPIRIYHKPADVYNATSWDSELVDDTYYHVIHGIYLDTGLAEVDTLVVASQEGITALHYGEDEQWQIEVLGEGDRSQLNNPDTADNAHQFFGSGNVEIAQVGADAYAYIPTLEPFHGNIAALYTKDNPGTGPSNVTWSRTILDVYGEPNENGEGAGHHLKVVDFNGDGNDEFIVAQRGPEPNKGIFYYEVDDPSALTFKDAVRISTSSAARIAIEDFDQDGRPDFATTGYCTENYFCTDNPQLLVFLNRIDQ